jgi:hypothetical protein
MASSKYKSLFEKKKSKKADNNRNNSPSKEKQKESSEIKDKLEIKQLKSALLKKIKDGKTAKKAALIIEEMIKSNKS